MTSTDPDPRELEILAAAQRAERHSPLGAPGVPDWAILAHLGVARRSAAARAVRERLSALFAAGALDRSTRHGREVWAVTARGRRRLQAARRRQGAPALPEAPQHSAWRNARTSAALEIERFRQRLHASVEEAARLLAADPPPHSDVWFQLAETLRRDARLVGSASHCLLEWSEPDDARADIDDRHEPDDAQLPRRRRERVRALRAGRRNVLLWQDPPR